MFLLNIPNLLSANGQKLIYPEFKLEISIPSSWKLLNENKNLKLNQINSTQILSQFILPNSSSTFRNNFSISVEPNYYPNFTSFKKNYTKKYIEEIKTYFPDFQIKEDKNFEPQSSIEINGFFSHFENNILIFNAIEYNKDFLLSYKLSCAQNDCKNYENDFTSILKTTQSEPQILFADEQKSITKPKVRTPVKTNKIQSDKKLKAPENIKPAPLPEKKSKVIDLWTQYKYPILIFIAILITIFTAKKIYSKIQLKKFTQTNVINYKTNQQSEISTQSIPKPNNQKPETNQNIENKIQN